MRGSTLALLTVAAAACHGSSPSPVSNNITTTGGTVAMSDGTSVAVPAGAVTQSTAVTVAPEGNAVSIDGVVLIGDTYRFGPEGQQFATPVTVTIAYDPSKLPSGMSASDITIMTAPVGSNDFTPLATTSVDATHVSAPTSHFSDFVAVVRANSSVDLAIAPPSDLASNASTDLASADLSSVPDLAGPTMCAPFQVNAMNCTLTSTACQLYQLNCAQTMCACIRLNNGAPTYVAKPGVYANTTQCPPIDIMSQMWTTECMFP
jgi:hypothetical protein